MKKKKPTQWCILQNYKTGTEKRLSENFKRDAYKRIADTLEWNAIREFLFLTDDTLTAERYMDWMDFLPVT